jgi:rRNA-processing protein FCF1
MDVVLDTNAVVSLGLLNPAFGSLRDYLHKTKSRLLIPEVVLEELRAQRRASVIKSVRKGLEANKELQGFVPSYKSMVRHLKAVDAEAAGLLFV